MPYTLWSRGRLLGESALAYRRSFPGLRVGDFEATPIGETLMPIILGVGPALKALHEAAEAVWASRSVSRRRRREGWPNEVRQSTEYADAMSLPDELASLALELHDPAGGVVATEDIWLQDTHRMVAAAREELSAEFPDMEFDDPEPWEPAFPRYQIYVALAGHDRAMSRLARRKQK